MTTTAELLHDGFERVREEVAAVLDGASDAVLRHRAGPRANTVAWLIWHLTRVQDAQVADALGHPDTWRGEGWMERCGLPFDPDATGYAQDPDEAARVDLGAAVLAGYHDAVAHHTLEWVAALADADLDRVVDERWDPPVTLGVRLVSVLADDLQHVGQAAYARGLAERAGT